MGSGVISQTWKSEVALGTPGTGWGTPGTVNFRLDDQDDPSMIMQPNYVPRVGYRGTRNEFRAAVGGKGTLGDISNFVATPDIMAQVLHLAMGSRSGTTISLVEGQVPVFTLQQNRAGVKGYEYTCKVASFSMNWVPDDHVRCSYSLVHEKEIKIAVGSLTSVAYDVKTPYQFHQVTFSLDGTVRDLYNLEFTLDNQLLYPEFVGGNQFPKCPGEGARMITGSFSREFIGEDLYNKFQNGDLASIVASGSNGTDTMIITFATVQYRELTRSKGDQKETENVSFTAVRSDGGGTPAMTATVTTA